MYDCVSLKLDDYDDSKPLEGMSVAQTLYGSGHGRQVEHECKVLDSDSGYVMGWLVFGAGRVVLLTVI